MLPMFLSAQCYPDRHNTSWSDAWLSCQTSKNPNQNRGQSHWAYYDFGRVYALGTMKIWNLNEVNIRNSGMRTLEVDYSLDGQVWQHLGNYEMDQAPGTSIYEGENVADWDGIQARYVIITPTDNFGGECMGFSEVRFNLHNSQDVSTAVEETPGPCLDVRVYPNPYTDHFTLDLSSECEENLRYTVTNVLGQTVMAREIPFLGSAQQIEVRTEHLPAGNYVLHIQQGTDYQSRKLIQLGR